MCGTQVVTFSYATWSVRYPELSAWVSQPMAQLFFNETCLYVDNSPTTLIRDPTVLALILNMMTAHIAALNAPINGAPSSPLVGRIDAATEGSATVHADMPAVPGSAAWFSQTKYGLAAWQAMIPYRTLRYFQPRRPAMRGGPLW